MYVFEIIENDEIMKFFTNSQIFFIIVRTHAYPYVSKYISIREMSEHEISEAFCDGTETSLANCNITVTSALKCKFAVGIRCLSGTYDPKVDSLT